MRYIHNNGSSFIFILIYFHFSRNLYFNNYYYNIYIWFSGISILILYILISFLGYILSWGQISYWGATVITNLLSFLPFYILWISGNYCISILTLQRYFLFHFLFSLISLSLILIHIYYLHFYTSNSFQDNNLDFIIFLDFYIIKDFYGFLIFLYFLFLQLFYFILSFSHSDNLLIINDLRTPLHIIPEWYFLSFYSILKFIPNKNTGFIIILISIFSFIILGEFKINISEFKNYNGLFTSNFYFNNFYNLFIGCQLPQEIRFSRYFILFNFLSIFNFISYNLK